VKDINCVLILKLIYCLCASGLRSCCVADADVHLNWWYCEYWFKL